MTSATPFFSVVIPVRNQAAFIHDAIASVLRQTFQSYEIIVVDDASTDSTVHQVLTFSTPAVRVLCLPHHHGVSLARNTGIASARGQWVAFLDADDLYLPGFLAAVAATAARFPTAGVVYTDILWQTAPDAAPPSATADPQPQLLRDYLADVVHRRRCEMSASSTAVHRHALSAAGLFPAAVPLGEDSDLWLRLAWTTHIAHVPASLAIYRCWAGNSDWERRSLESEPYWMGTYREWLANGRIPKELQPSARSYYCWTLLNRAMLYSRRGNHTAALHSLKATLSQGAPARHLLRTVAFLTRNLISAA